MPPVPSTLPSDPSHHQPRITGANLFLDRVGTMKLLSVLSTAAALALLLGQMAAADPCPTLRVTSKAPKVVRNIKLYTVILGVKNTGSTAANNVEIDVSSEEEGCVRGGCQRRERQTGLYSAACGTDGAPRIGSLDIPSPSPSPIPHIQTFR